MIETNPKRIHLATARRSDFAGDVWIASKTPPHVEVRYLEGSVATLQDVGVGSDFRLVLDFGIVHGLAPTEVEVVARELSAVATSDATLLMYAFSPGRKGPTPRGLSREEVEAAYAGWRVVDEQLFDVSDMPAVFKKANPRWYRLRRD